MIQMRNFKTIAPYTFLLFVILVLFRQLSETFYQQDEWLALGNMSIYGWDYFFLGSPNFFQAILGEGRVASRVVTYFLLGSFPFSVVPLASYGVLLHTINTFLIYRLINNFLKSTGYAFIGASFFAVNAVSHQAVTWPAAVVGTLTATTLILLSFFTYFRFLGGYGFGGNHSLQVRWLVVTVMLLYFSLHFKEIGIFLFAFLSIATFLMKRELFFSKIKLLIGLASPFIIIVFYKIIQLRQRTTEANLYITGLQENFFSTILLRAVSYPLTSFSLMFVPGEHFLEFARVVLRQVYPFFSNSANDILIAQSVVLDLLAIILTFALLWVIYFFIRKEELKDKKIVIFWLTFSFVGFLPYVVLSKDFSYLEGRYYYLPVAGAAFLFAWLIKRIKEIFGRKIFFGLAMPFVFLYILFHASVVRAAVAEQVRLSDLRRDFISQLKTFAPSLDNDKNVFYIAGDQNYWADGNKVPFQQGTGYTLMVLYNDSGKIPKEFLKEAFLFEIGGQGYREIGDKGFGYFWYKEELKEAAKLYNLQPSSIINLYYDSEEKKLSELGNAI